MNTKFQKTDLTEITTELIIEIIKYVYSEGHNSHAPLGCSGDTFILFGLSRRKEISLRLHSGDVKLLVTDNIGGFLFYGGFDISFLPISFISKQYYNIIQNVKHLLINTSKRTVITEDDKEKMFKNRQIFDRMFIHL